MLIPYKNRFLKVFISSVVLFIISIGIMVAMVNLTYQFNNRFSSGQQVNTDLLSFIKPVTFLVVAMLIAGEGLLIYSHYKGYPGWFALLFLINVFGLAILFLLPDKTKNQNLINSNGNINQSAQNKFPPQ